MAEQLDPKAAWPRHLQEPWSDCTARGEVNGRNPPTTLVEAYLQVAEAQRRRLAGIPWGDGTHDLGVDEESLFADLTPTRATCATCGASHLEHFYRSKRDGRTLCVACFVQRVERGLASGGSRRGSDASHS